MTPKHEAFIDLENTLATKIQAAWARQWIPISKRVQRAIKDKDFTKAHDEVDKVDFAPLVKRNMRLAETVGNAALLLGHSRLVSTAKADISDPQQQLILDNLLTQFETTLSSNATFAVRKEGHRLIEKARGEEQTLLKRDDISIKVGVQVAAAGKGFVGIASSLHVSRLNSFGFIAEAVAQNIETYTINEVMDSLTCPVCREMNGRVFTISQGFNHALSIMQNDDPDSLRTLAPWPRQDEKTVRRLKGMDSTELANAGLSLPPFHPGCRGIITEGGEFIEVNTPSIITDVASLFAVGGAGLLFGDQEEEIEEMA